MKTLSIALLTLLTLSLNCNSRRPTSENGTAGNATTQPMKNDESATRFTGTLQGGMMAIGGETTGYLLNRDDGTRLEVDVSRVFNDARALEGKRVTVTGKMTEKDYVERGPTKILVAERIQAAR